SPTIEKLLERLPIVGDACDLDLILFLSRHPHALLTSEELAAYVGYDMQQLVRALDTLIAEGWVSRSQNRSHAARLYVLQLARPSGGGLLQPLVQYASTREGRAAVLKALKARQSTRNRDIGPKTRLDPQDGPMRDVAVRYA